MAPNVGRFSLQWEQHGVSPTAEKVAESSTRTGAASGVSQTEETVWSSIRSTASVEHDVRRILLRPKRQGVSKGARSTRRLRGELLMKDGVREARELRLMRHRQSWSHDSRGASRSRRTEMQRPSRRRQGGQRRLWEALGAHLRLGATQERLRQPQGAR